MHLVTYPHHFTAVVTIGFEQTLYTATEGVDPVVELCAIVFGGTELEREVVVSFATRDGSATSIGGSGNSTVIKLDEGGKCGLPHLNEPLLHVHESICSSSPL